MKRTRTIPLLPVASPASPPAGAFRLTDRNAVGGGPESNSVTIARR